MNCLNVLHVSELQMELLQRSAELGAGHFQKNPPARNVL